MRSNLLWVALFATVVVAGCNCGSKVANIDDDGTTSVVELDAGLPPSANAGADMDLCAGVGATLGAPAIDGLQYAWSPTDGLSSPTSAQPVATPSVTTTYTLTVTDPSNNQFSTDTVTVVVHGLPVARIGDGVGGAAPATACLGSTWSASAASSAAIFPGTIASYEWTHGSATATTRELSVPTSTTGTQTVKLTVTDSFGCSSEAQTSFDVTGLPVANAGPDQYVSAFGTITLNGSATGGTPPYSYTWTSSDPACTPGYCFSGQDTATPTVKPAMDSDLTVKVTDANGCIGEDTTHLTVAETLVANAGPDVTVCEGASTTVGLNTAGGMPPYSYSWAASPSCSVPDCMTSDTDATPTVSPLVSTTFTESVSDSLGANSVSAVTVTVLPDAGQAGGDVVVAPGAATLLGPSSGTAGAIYAWTCNRSDCGLDDATSATPTARPTKSTRYTLSAGYSSGLCSSTTSQTAWVSYEVATVPADGTASWPVTSSLEVLFPAPVDTSTVTSSTVVLTDALTGAVIPTTRTWNSDNTLLTVTPGSGYVAGADYTLTLSGGPNGIRTADTVLGNVLQTDVLVDFTTSSADLTPPSAINLVPAPDAGNVPLSTSVQITFDEPVAPSSVNTNTVTLTGGGQQATGTVSYDFANHIAVLTPSADLLPTTLYTATIAGVADLSGNLANLSWTFTTSVIPDTTPPTVASVIPANGAINVPSGTAVVVTFSEAVLSSSTVGAITLTNTASGATVPGTITYNAATFTATFTPSGFFDSEATYQVTVTGVQDLSGNAMTAPFLSTFVSMRTLFRDTFENGSGNWTLSPVGSSVWGLTSQQYSSATHSLTDSVVGKYVASLTTYAEQTSSIDVSGLTTVNVSFALRTRLEKNRDFFYVEYQLDNGSWITVNKPGTVTGWSGNVAWARYSFPVTLNGATQLRVRFRLTTNGTRNFDGVYVDDVLFQAPTP